MGGKTCWLRTRIIERTSERKQEKEILCVSVCVCVRRREGKKEREREFNPTFPVTLDFRVFLQPSLGTCYRVDYARHAEFMNANDPLGSKDSVSNCSRSSNHFYVI